MPSTDSTEQKLVFTTGEAAKLCGVNLRTVIRWVERGELDAYSLPGRGDKRIPREALQAFMQRHGMPLPPELASPETTTPTAEAPTEQGVNPNVVLIVDDDVSFAKALYRTLRQAGYTPHRVHSGFEAGMKLMELRPALMTLDLHMPGMRGEQVLDSITTNHPKGLATKVLVVSAETDDRLAKTIELGADDVLPKPFDNETLLNKVEDLIGKPR